MTVVSDSPHPRAPLRRRLAALGALTLGVVVTVVTVVLAVTDLVQLAVFLALVVVVFVALWYAFSRAGRGRWFATALAVAAAAAVAALVVTAQPLDLLIRLAMLAAAALLARYALGRDTASLKHAATSGTPVGAAERGVLIMNLKSGGGKAERFGLAEECRHRGIEPVVLQPGDDLLTLAHDAIDAGADVIGMAGGDGSQALVASVAAERGIPMVVVPAGTRNHLALDLGIDRDDVVGALDAFGAAVERRMDLSDVNGRVFINNVSLGLYATIVQSPEYRDAKVETTLAVLPQVLGPGTAPVDLRFDGPHGTHHDGAHLVQVSNGPYGRTMRTLGSRPRLDAGVLGIVSLVVPDDRAAAHFLAALAAGRPDSFEGYQTWESGTFEVDSAGPVAIGLDGEAMELDPPLHFAIRPRVLRVRLAKDAIGLSPAARATLLRRFLPDLLHVAMGTPVTSQG